MATASITIKNLSRNAALQLLTNVQQNHGKSYAFQGRDTHRFYNANQITAEVVVDENEHGYDFSKNTFRIYSNYFVQSTLEELIKKND